jgi:hypothetical protein
MVWFLLLFTSHSYGKADPIYMGKSENKVPYFIATK